VFGEISTGAADDLAKVSDIARRMVARFGMAEGIGQVVYEDERQAMLGETYGVARAKDYSEATAREIDLAVRELVEEAFVQAQSILAERRPDLDRGAGLLLKKETITASDFPPILGRRVPSSTSEAKRKQQPRFGRDGRSVMPSDALTTRG
jgi:cell division protease FtsH